MTASDPWSGLRRWTQARIALGRSGDGLPTRHVLEFQLAHARARDAVHLALDTARMAAALAAFDPIVVASQAADRAHYLQRPDLGRRLDPACRDRLRPGSYDAALVVADGLSALGAHENARAVAERLRALLPEWRWAPLVIALQARVALGDAIAEALGAAMVVVLIGERPGLSAPDSLGAYITWHPRAGATRDAARNCVSNIRSAGLSAADAGARIAALMSMARRLGATGTLLKEDAALALIADGGTHCKDL